MKSIEVIIPSSMENIDSSADPSTAYLQAFGSGIATAHDAASIVSSLPSFGSISQSHGEEIDNQRDVLMPIEQNCIVSTSSFSQVQLKPNSSTTPLSKTNSSVYGSASSLGFSSSSEEITSTSSAGIHQDFDNHSISA